jgi:hypothetical protein
MALLDAQRTAQGSSLFEGCSQGVGTQLGGLGIVHQGDVGFQRQTLSPGMADGV